VNEGLPDGATPLDEDEAEGLIPDHITTRGELNEWEQQNILAAERWLLATNERNVLDEAFVRLLHRKMFDETWKWAGEFRRTNKSSGVDWPSIPTALRDLLEDARFWLDHHTYSPSEAAVRVHHRLVKVHCFANGNGRHARLYADFWLQIQRLPRLAWGNELDKDGSTPRDAYIGALRSADREEFEPLLEFVGIRSQK
jgi:Fic-DOC domain mobile mystery protein B